MCVLGWSMVQYSAGAIVRAFSNEIIMYVKVVPHLIARERVRARAHTDYSCGSDLVFMYIMYLCF